MNTATFFFWINITKNIREYCKSCTTCQKTVTKGRISTAPFDSISVTTTPFDVVSENLIGPMNPPSKENHRYILTVVDHATRYPQAVPFLDKTSDAVADGLISIFSRLGIPRKIITDQGKQFTSELLLFLLLLSGV